ncbi:hypothetical protein Pan216_17300 [Planctomycetes bacterium Pan216]|uniref:Cytochrome oxidase subunit I profile domain-containing protein n=1 Tax=Kolteria novifilia TaxID=2527975 RepID=A0A518B1M8_9BACT|nr:hypothetical protein Pan216_17300 [Planctomycetes bacterium Pan216]
MSDAVAATVEWTPEKRRAYFARERAGIDASTRLPVLTFFAASVFWLLVGTTLAIIASVKMHWPEFLESFSWLTFGRARSAHLDTMAYGWTAQVGLGVSLWLIARLARAPLRWPRLLVGAAGLWNAAVLAGAIGVLGGQMQSVEWLEFPPFVAPLLALAFVVIAMSALTTFGDRQEGHIYVSQWYLFGALFWFPWLYVVANVLILFQPVRGVLQASVNWWFAHNYLGLYLTPIGLASAYYLIPKVIGRPVYSYYLSIIGFWALAFFYNSAGIHHLIGGPMPAWLITYSIVASVMMLIPVGTVAINHHMTTVNHFRLVLYSPTLRFIVFGAMSYTAVSVQGALQSLRTVNEVSHFTHYTVAHAHLGVYAFFTMTMFGSLYYIVPRLTKWEWASARLIRLHFWMTAGGIMLYFLSLTWAGWYQGQMLNDANVPFMDIVKYTLPYLRTRSIAAVMLAVGHLVFAYLFVLNLLHRGEPRRDPTILGDVKEYRDMIGSEGAPQ